MGYDGESRPARYRAFISYSHRDAAFGRRLHRRLEAYRVPRRLVGRPTPFGPAPARLGPIFRDRDELPAADDLSAEIRRALEESAVLIVVCSPAARASPWVAREIEYFRGLGRPVLAALVDGEPDEAFPDVLREPAAADFRRVGDGPGLAFLRLVAGLAGVGLDELVQRDAQRRLRGVMAVTAVAVAGVVALGTTTLIAVSARREAERQRAEAEGLVEFMLTDLRDRLKGVGRLDVLTAVNRKALGYYAGQDLERMPPESLERRARVLHAMGEDDEARGELDAAERKFQEARRTTAALLAAKPDDPERVFDHAQSEYWVGFVDYRRGRKAAALAGFERYRQLAQQLVRRDPRNPKYLKELAYAEGDLCTAALAKPPDAPAALTHCAAALSAMETVEREAPADPAVRKDVMNRHAWMADAYRLSGDLAAARRERSAQQERLEALIAADPRDMSLRRSWVGLQQSLAVIEILSGEREVARRRLVKAQATVRGMQAFDPENQAWAQLSRKLSGTLSYVDQQQP